MEGHTWIYVIAILAYLYYISKVADRNRYLLMKKSRLPRIDRRAQDFESQLQQHRQFKRENRKFKKRTVIIFLIIPTVEIITHFLLGGYELSGQLLTVIFFVLFFTVLLLVLIFQSRNQQSLPSKKYTRPTEFITD